MKRFYSLIIMVLVLALLPSATILAHNKKTNIKVIVNNKKSNIKVTVNNKTMKYEVKPYTKGKEVMVAVGETAEALGAKVTWDKKSKTTWIKLDLMNIEIPVGKKEIYIHRDADFSGIPEKVKLSTPVVMTKNTVMVPAIKFFESIGMDVTWDSKAGKLNISKNTDEIFYSNITKEDISKIKKVNDWYNKNQKKAGISYLSYKDVMYVLVGAGSKPTGGYTVGINKFTFTSKSTAFVDAYVQKPNPDMMVTQVETFPSLFIKIEGYKSLKVVKGDVTEVVIGDVPNSVRYEEIEADFVKGNKTLMNWYNENNTKRGISYIREGGYVYALIGAGEKPTGGFTIQIDNVFYSSTDTVTINAKVNPPGDNVRVMMVITYPSTLIRFKSDTVKTVVGDIIDSDYIGKDKWVTFDSSTVLKMELLNLEHVKLRDIIGAEKDAIIAGFNNATIDPNAYIEMITGNILKVSLSDGYVLSFTSYGSKTNVIVNFAKENDSRSYHIVAPQVAELLLK